MGCSYGQNEWGRWVLACDGCGSIGGVRKVKCPYNYCPATALCKTCREAQPSLAERRKIHAVCETRMADIAIEAARERAILAAGGCVLRAAKQTAEDCCHVLFEGAEGMVGFYMPRQAYESVPRYTPGKGLIRRTLTPDDYRAVTTLSEAPGAF